ncbi:oocyte zinc finger protein XlCOF28-like [Mercenaria mercenaria]|uniref:oocyte zinc finger protein XlCOF28-like n=1 Tax=Mercenaria mercenaria TaxID=6596 RepID=UPI00234F1773|nr:oocyte zinc finger protein XlCOF28-like [Mercenaria mercenaria]XP_045180381.2 oocyte zinc finger protein XlCOF28-like [Mercenaria mercenaria]
MRDVHVLVIQDGPMQALGTKSAKDPSSLKCEQCSKTFTRSWLLKNHQRVHTGERPYKCAFCDKAFADKSNLRQHQKIHTTTEKLFQCGICQRTFAQRRYLMKHATEIHRDVSMSLYGSPTSEQKEKEEEPVRLAAEKQTTKISAAAVQTAAEIPNKSADHQYLTRQKSRTKTVSESKDDKETKEKKYSEQDLKDFIKSNQKTMEKNGYIFIKQNFESLDTEPTLTEISEVPVTAIKDEVALKTDGETGNQILNVNGKMVYLQMENKLVNKTQALSQNSQVTTQSTQNPAHSCYH